MATLRLLLDEDVRPLIARMLRARGHDVVSAREMGWTSVDDSELLQRAIKEGRVVVTHNIADYTRPAAEYAAQGWEHLGIIVSDQIPYRVVFSRLLRLLGQRRAEDVHNTVDWLSNYR